jgi:hypothetical protein
MYNHFIMRFISLACCGMLLFSCIGSFITDNPIGTYIGAGLGFCFGSFMAWYGQNRSS